MHCSLRQRATQQTTPTVFRMNRRDNVCKIFQLYPSKRTPIDDFRHATHCYRSTKKERCPNQCPLPSTTVMQPLIVNKKGKVSKSTLFLHMPIGGIDHHGHTKAKSGPLENTSGAGMRSALAVLLHHGCIGRVVFGRPRE